MLIFSNFLEGIVLPDHRGHFGIYGGKYVPETLMSPIEELERAYIKSKGDKKFSSLLKDYLKNYVGRSTPLFLAKNLTKKLGGAKIYLKREDLCHTGAHKINNAIAQTLLAKKMGKKRIIAETGAGPEREVARRRRGGGAGPVRRARQLHAHLAAAGGGLRRHGDRRDCRRPHLFPARRPAPVGTGAERGRFQAMTRPIP